MAAAIERALARSALSSLLKTLKSLKNSVKNTTEELLAALKSSAKTGISTVDDVLSNLKVNKTGRGFLTVAEDVPLSRLERIIKSADLDSLAKLTESTGRVTAKEKSAFKQIIGDTAESQIHNLDELTSTASKSSKFSDLNIKKIAADTPAETVAKIKNAESKFLKYGKPGAAIALTIGVAYVVVDGLTKATSERTGCFMVTTINGKTQSCKVSSLTCSSEASTGNLCGNASEKYELNVVLALLSLETTDNNTQTYKDEICKIAGIAQADYMTKFNDIINNGKFSEIFDYVQKNIKGLTDGNKKTICSISTIADVDKKLPLCRMCDPAAAPLSTTFVDSSHLADNITFECRNPTILDTIIDIGKSTGQDLLSSVANSIWTFAKPFAIAAGVFALVAFVIALVLKLINKSKSYKVASTVNAALEPISNNFRNLTTQNLNQYTRFA